MALPQAEAEELLDDSSFVGPSPSPSATTYVVLLRGDFNDAGGAPMGWAVSLGHGGDTLTTVMAARPEVTDRTWTPLELPSPQASP